MKKAVALLLVVGLVLGAGLIGVLALTGDGNQSTPDERTSSGPAPTTTPKPDATQPPRPALARYYSQQLDWSSCQDSFECATLTVPLDYRRPGGKTIQLALLKVPAEDPGKRIGSLVVNPGGPGAPGTQYAAQASQAFRDPVRERYDIVGFDPRGTGSSDPVDCLPDDQLDAFVATDPDPDTPAEVSAYERFVDELGTGCLARSGAIAEHVSTIEAARDIDILRAALGESTLDYFGASYGTKLGATYADLFPDKAGRLVLDGAVDLSLSAREASLEQAGGFETALRAYVADCVAGDDCFLGDTVQEGLDRIKTFLADVDASPLDAGGDRKLMEGNAFYGVALPLYNRDYWPILDRALGDGFDGDGSVLLQLSDLYSSRDDDGTYADNSAEAIYAINCLDDPYSIPASDVPAQYTDFEKASPTFGKVFAWGLTNCAGITYRSTEKPRTVTGAGAPPIVVVGTTRDPATPYAWAVALAGQLESGVLVTRDGDGHTGYNSGNACVDDAVEGYLLDGTVPEDGLSC